MERGRSAALAAPKEARPSRVAQAIPLVAALRRYSRRDARADAIAGLSLAALVVPQGLAYAQLAGLPAVVGLYTAIGGMVVYGLLGPSRFITVGPESTVAIIIADALVLLAAPAGPRYLALTMLLAVMTGLFLWLGAIVKAGFIVRFLSAPVLIGYLAGAGIVIIMSQLSKAMGVHASDAYPTAIQGIIVEAPHTNWLAVAIAVGTIAIVLALRKVAPKLPGPLIALALATGISYVAHWPGRIDTVGDLPGGFVNPFAHLDQLLWTDVFQLAPTALSIAVFVFATTALTSKAIDPEAGDVQPTREFVALGAASVGSALLGGYPTNSSDTRSFFLAQSGSKTQLANIVCALAVTAVVLWAMPLFSALPLAALAGVILVTAVRLLDIAGMRRLRRLRTSDFVLAGVTLVGVLVLGPLAGIAVGVVASLGDIVRRTVSPRTSELAQVPGEVGAWRDAANLGEPGRVPGVVVYRFDAPLFFANAEVFRGDILRLVEQAPEPVQAVVVSAEGISDLDVTGAEALERLAADLKQRGIALSFARVRGHVRELMAATGVLEHLDDDALHLRIEDAVRAADRRTPPES